MRSALALMLLCGCVPYLERWRPEIVGTARWHDGAAASGVRIEVCSRSHWAPVGQCRVSASAVTSAEGAFHFDAWHAWEWFGIEAPLPVQDVTAVVGETSQTPVATWSLKAPTQTLDLELSR